MDMGSRILFDISFSFAELRSSLHSAMLSAVTLIW